MSKKNRKKKILTNITEADKTPLVTSLLEIIADQELEIQRLKDENARLKKKPKRPVLKPSITGKLDKDSIKKNSKPKSTQKKMTKDLQIHNTVDLQPDSIPEGSKFLWYRDFIVQDIKIEPYNTKYRRAVWKTPDGKIIRAKLPKYVKGHYGIELETHIMHLYHELDATQPWILDHLIEIGIKISAGKIDQLLSNDKEIFHKEKEEILKQGLKISPYIVSDDTGQRHMGKNGFCTHIGNDLFAYFKSSNSKSRINFLETLQGAKTEYIINGYAIEYYENQDFPKDKLMLLKRSKGKKFSNKTKGPTFNHSNEKKSKKNFQFTSSGVQ